MPKPEKNLPGMTKEQIEKRVREGKMGLDEAMKLLSGGVRFAVAEKSGWLSIYFPNRIFPVNMPIENADELLQADNLSKMREFIAENRDKFKTRKDRKEK